MYSPTAFTEEDRSEIVTLLRQMAFGHLVTTRSGVDPLQASALPFLVDDELKCVRAHIARANDQWRTIDGATALLIVPGYDTYVSPRWYPSKAEHGRVVPTWNYELVHLSGVVEVHDDAEWKRTMVEDLTNHHEARISNSDAQRPWLLDDAPDSFIDGQLKAIVGIELTVANVEAKRKLSQNRAEGDRLATAAALAKSDNTNDRRLAAVMGSNPP